MPLNEDDNDETPLQFQRSFGAGIKRKRVEFVPQSATPSSVSVASLEAGPSLQDVYLSIVLPKAALVTNPIDTQAGASILKPDMPVLASLPEAAKRSRKEHHLCNLCHLPIGGEETVVPHEASLAHQVCLEHSFPPSALDRHRKGLTYLSAYGWDPDARQGLGVAGDGRLYPIRTKMKEDNSGIGATIGHVKKVGREQKLDAGEVRRRDKELLKKSRKMEQLFYGRDDVNKHLGLEL